MKNFTIRKATTNDIENLLQFEQEIIKTERQFDETLKPSVINYYDIKDMVRNQNAEFLVAEINGEIVACGFARIEKSKPYLRHEKHAYLGLMYVTAEHRGKGINQEIIEHLKDWARTKNINELRLDVYAENAAAIRAYEKVGFKKHLIEMRLGL